MLPDLVKHSIERHMDWSIGEPVESQPPHETGLVLPSDCLLTALGEIGLAEKFCITDGDGQTQLNNVLQGTRFMFSGGKGLYITPDSLPRQNKLADASAKTVIGIDEIFRQEVGLAEEVVTEPIVQLVVGRYQPISYVNKPHLDFGAKFPVISYKALLDGQFRSQFYPGEYFINGEDYSAFGSEEDTIGSRSYPAGVTAEVWDTVHGGPVSPESLEDSRVLLGVSYRLRPYLGRMPRIGL